MKKITFTRSELHQLVWSESLPTLAKKYDSTYNELRNICIDLNIPLPKAGYWQNKSLGKLVIVEPLPIKSTSQKEVTLSLLEAGDERKKVVKRLSKVKTDLHKEDVFEVSSKPSAPDPLVTAAKNSLAKKEASWGRYGGLLSTQRNEFNIRVAPQNVTRALGFADTLIKTLKGRNYVIKFQNDDTMAVVNGQEIKICIKEMMKRVIRHDGNWERTDLIPTGILSFRMGEGYREVIWKDGKQSLEEQLSNIIDKLVRESERKKTEREEIDKWHKEYQEKLRIEHEIQQQREKEEADFTQLLVDADRWQKSKVARSYIDMIETNAISKGEISEELKNWLTWARKRIEGYDPLNKPKAINIDTVEGSSDTELDDEN